MHRMIAGPTKRPVRFGTGFLCAAVFCCMAASAGHAGAYAQEMPALQSPVRIALAPDGSVLVSDCKRQAILTLDRDSLAVCGELSIAGIPSGLAAGNGLYYVGNETAKRVGAYTPAGEWQYDLGGDFAIQQPNDIAVDQETGEVFVVDTFKRCVRVFGKTGQYLRSIPASNEEPGGLANPTALALDQDRGEVLVSDFGAADASVGPQIQVFQYDGTYVGAISGISTPQGEGLRRPQGLATDADGRVYLVDSLTSMVLVYDRDAHELVKTLGEYGTEPGQLALPLDIAIDPMSKNVLVTNNRAKRVELFKGAALQGTVKGEGEGEEAHAEGEGENEGEQSTKSFGCGASFGGNAAGRFEDIAILTLVGLLLAGSARSDSSRFEKGRRRLGFRQVLALATLCAFGLPAPVHAQTPVHECTECHGVWEPAGQDLLHNPSPEILCLTCHGPGGISIYKVDVHTNAAGSSRSFRFTCTDCHETYMNQQNWHGGTNLKTVLPEIDSPNSGIRQAAFESFGSTAGKPTLHSFADADEDADGYYDGICETCHTLTRNHRNNGSGNHTHYRGQNCLACHPHDASFLPSGGACDSCHGAPPATGAHLKHFGGEAALASYGGMENLSTAGAYIFECGTCHPASFEKHRNGVVDVELYDAAAPAGTLKSKNPSSASYAQGPDTLTDPDGIGYTLGTCSNVYCHSKTDWASPNPISNPLIDSGTGKYIVDANGNLTYNPYAVTETQSYSSVGWGGVSLTCNGCHRNGPQTSSPNVQAGVGDSHSWVDSYGYDNLHAWNMGFDPLMCRTCHYDTVTASMTWTRDGMGVATYGDVPIANKAKHVNGARDVAFDTVDPVIYTNTFNLATASYNPADKTCSAVSCHLNQTKPQWGIPYRWWTNECDYCHRYSGLFPAPAGKTAVSFLKTSPFHENEPKPNCHTCHLASR